MRRIAVVMLLVCASVGLVASPALAATPAPGYAVTVYARDFPTGWCCGGVGPIGLGFDQGNRLWVADVANSTLYRFNPGGGSATTAFSAPLPGDPVGLAFDKGGELWVARYSSHDIVQINLTTGAIARVVPLPQAPLGVASDPANGDIYIGTSGTDQLLRMANPTSASPVVSTFASGLPGHDGVSMAPDGSLYLATGSSITKVNGPRSSSPGTSSALVSIPVPDGTAVGASSDPSNPPFLVVNRNDGIISKVSLQGTPTITNLMTNGERGDFVTVGADGCLYATQNSSILRLTHSDGSCDLAPPGETPQLTYTGDTSADYHDMAHLAARLKTKAGSPISNAQLTFLGAGFACGGTTDANGNASCDAKANLVPQVSQITVRYAGSAGVYAAANATVDFTIASEETTLTTMPVRTEDQHAVGVSATLLEDGATPIANRTVEFTPQGAPAPTCTAKTGADGTANCRIDVGANPQATFAANFPGDAYYLAASATSDVTITRMQGRARALVAIVAGSQQDLGGADSGDRESIDPGSESASATPLDSPATGGALTSATVKFAKGPDTVTSTATIADATVLPLQLGITVKGLSAVASATCAGARGSISLSQLAVSGMPVASVDQIAPNTVVPLATGGSITLDEQIPIAGGLIVNGAHVVIPGVADVVLGQARAALVDCP